MTSMRIYIVAILAFSIMTTDGQLGPPPGSSIINLVDPTILKHQGFYYQYGTVEKKTGNGFHMYVLGDLKSCKLSDRHDGYALKKAMDLERQDFGGHWWM